MVLPNRRRTGIEGEFVVVWDVWLPISPLHSLNTLQNRQTLLHPLYHQQLLEVISYPLNLLLYWCQPLKLFLEPCQLFLAIIFTFAVFRLPLPIKSWTIALVMTLVLVRIPQSLVFNGLDLYLRSSTWILLISTWVKALNTNAVSLRKFCCTLDWDILLTYWRNQFNTL